MKCTVLLCLVGVALGALNHDQIRGLKRLIKGLDNVFPTCNLILFKEKVDYDTADERCKNFDIGMGTDLEGNLATVNDDDKNTDLKLLLEMAYPIKEASANKWGDDRWVWAGMRKVSNNDGSKKGRVYDAEDWEWADGSHPGEFHQWMKNQPDQKTQKNNGVKLLQNQMRISHKGHWDDTFVYKTHPYACDYQGKYIISATRHTWWDAKEACETAGLHLAKVRNDAEITEITAAAEYFLGVRDEAKKVFAAENWVWLGGNDLDTEGEWTWADGEPIDFGAFNGDKFRLPNPDNADYIGERGQDVLSISKWGQFDDSFDTKRRRPFACQCPDT